MAAPPTFAAPAAYGPGTVISYCIERGVNAGEYAGAVIVEKNTTFDTDGDCALVYFQRGERTPFSIESAKYATSGVGTWKVKA